MEEERDFVVFEDDDGNSFELDVIDYFFYDGQEYAILIDPETADDCQHGEGDCGCQLECDVYIMKVVTDGDNEEFLPADDALMDTLSQIAQERLEQIDALDELEEDSDGDGGQ